MGDCVLVSSRKQWVDDLHNGAGTADGGTGVGPELFEGHREYQENQRGVSYETLLTPYLRDATEIAITDPYIRPFHQARTSWN